MANKLPITIFYDASCRLCSAEIEAVTMHADENQFVLVDCSSPGFDDTPYRSAGITREVMMDALHVRNGWGAWFVGVDAFELIYHAIGLDVVARFWGGRFTRPFTVRIYPWIARHRQIISWSGLPLLFRLWGRCAARRANLRSRRCTDGTCSM